MAIKNIICHGIGFSPGSVKFMPTYGFLAGAAAVVIRRVSENIAAIRQQRRIKWRRRGMIGPNPG